MTIEIFEKTIKPFINELYIDVCGNYVKYTYSCNNQFVSYTFYKDNLVEVFIHNFATNERYIKTIK